jgi:SNF family Na+-dependent transporter
MAETKEAWGSRIGLILAIAGNAVGLGNFLRFPVQAVQNGGGAFIIPYLVSFLIMGIPLLWVEWGIGRYGGVRGHHSTPFIMDKMGKGFIWKYIGVFGIFSNIAIASYYCYIESWTLSYIMHSIVGTFNGMTQAEVSLFFDNYLNVMFSTTGIPFEAIIFFVVCLILNTWILSRGLSGGIEIAAKIAVPLLIIFGIFLAIQAFLLKAGVNGAIYDGFVGFNFLWTPQLDSLGNPKVWLAAAGQIFFTLSVGMGSIQCYASYLKERDDIALNSMSAGWMNEFVEVVIGSAIIIPISIGYFGIDKVVALVEQGGMGLAFRTLPFLFTQWGNVMGALAGVAFFGLLFFAGITSSLAMGTPVMGFLRDEFKWKRRPAAAAFGASIFIFGLPTVLFIQQGVFDEYDYWAGTVALFVFAMLEAILFSWVFGIEKGWKEINKGGDIKIPIIYKYILKYITPVMLIIVFLGALLRPVGDDWTSIGTDRWELHENSIIGHIMHKGIGPNNKYFAGEFYSEATGTVSKIDKGKHGYIELSATLDGQPQVIARYSISDDDEILVKEGDFVKTGTPLYKGRVINNIFFVDMSRLLLLLLFLGISYLVWLANRRNKKLLNTNEV